MSVVDSKRVLRDVVDVFLGAMKALRLGVLGCGIDEHGDVYVQCRLPQPGVKGVESFQTNVSNMARDVILLDRDQPQLGIDPRISSPSCLGEKIRAVVAHRMAIIEAVMETDEQEWRRKLDAVGSRSGRLRVWKATEDGELTTTLWYEQGEVVQ